MKVFSTCLAVLALLAIPVWSGASVRKLEVKDLAANATEIVAGTVLSLEPSWQDGRIVTRVTLSVSDTLKGSAAATTSFQIPGGTIGSVTMRTGEGPSFRLGEEVVVFLRKGVCECDVYGWFQGKFSVSRAMIRELKGVSREQFLAEVRELVQRQKGEGR